MNTVPTSEPEYQNATISKLHKNATCTSPAAARLSNSVSAETSAFGESGNSDDQLVLKAMKGSHPAFIQLCARHNEALRRRIFRIVGNLEDTEDILQETILSAYLNLRCFRGQCKFNTWFTTIGTNKALMHLRRRRVRPQIGFDSPAPNAWEMPDPSLNAEEMYSCRQLRQMVCEAMGNLPSPLREVIEHFYGGECSIADTAEACGITVPAAKSRLLRARHMLRERTAHLFQLHELNQVRHQSPVGAKRKP